MFQVTTQYSSAKLSLFPWRYWSHLPPWRHTDPVLCSSLPVHWYLGSLFAFQSQRQGRWKAGWIGHGAEKWIKCQCLVFSWQLCPSWAATAGTDQPGVCLFLEWLQLWYLTCGHLKHIIETFDNSRQYHFLIFMSIIKSVRIAQSVEPLPLNCMIVGSIPGTANSEYE